MAPTIDMCTVRRRGEERGKGGHRGSNRGAMSPLMPAGTGLAREEEGRREEREWAAAGQKGGRARK